MLPQMGRDATTGRRALAAVGLVGVPVLVELYRRVLAIPQRPSWPPPRDAVTSAGAQAATEARAPGPLDFAWSTAATIEPWIEGANFFPRIFADVEAASSSVHILMFGWREGTVGTQMAELLKRKLAEGVQVRVIVDGFGSRPYAAAREMFTGLDAEGAEIVVNDFSAFERRGLFPDRQQRRWRERRAGPGRPSQAVRGRRNRRVDRWRGSRGPLRERRLPRCDGARHRRRRAAGAGGLPDRFPRSRRPVAGRPRRPVPRAARTRHDAGRACGGDPRRAGRGHAGNPRADRPGDRPARHRERLSHRPRRDRPDRRGRPARREGSAARLGDLEQRPGERRPPASLRGAGRGGRRGVGAAGHRRAREGGGRRRPRQLRHRQPRRLGALPQLGDHDDRPEPRARGALRRADVRARHRPRQSRRATDGARERLECWLWDKLTFLL